MCPLPQIGRQRQWQTRTLGVQAGVEQDSRSPHQLNLLPLLSLSLSLFPLPMSVCVVGSGAAFFSFSLLPLHTTRERRRREEICVIRGETHVSLVSGSSSSQRQKEPGNSSKSGVHGSSSIEARGENTRTVASPRPEMTPVPVIASSMRNKMCSQKKFQKSNELAGKKKNTSHTRDCCMHSCQSDLHTSGHLTLRSFRLLASGF